MRKKSCFSLIFKMNDFNSTVLQIFLTIFSICVTFSYNMFIVR